MKKATLKGFAVAALALAMVLVGCNNNATSNIETVRPDAVEVTAKAYPGYNYVCWTIPENFQSSTIKVIRDDGTVITPASGTYYKVDTDIKDGVTYTYTVYVTGTSEDKVEYQYKGTDVTTISDISTDVKGVIYAGNSSSDSCKAINPICIKDGKLMTALDLCDYEVGGDSDFVIDEDNFVFEKEANGKNYYVAFPTKQYLNYRVNVYRGNELDVFGLNAGDFSNTADVSATQKFYTNDGAKRYSCGILSAGTYTAVVQVSAVNQEYQKSYVTAKNTFTVDALDVATASKDLTAGYISADTIRVVWTPATKAADAKDWEASKYTVYVQDKATGVWNAIAGTVKVAEDDEKEAPALAAAKADTHASKTVYYAEYKVPSNEVAYDFAVVLSDNGKIESFANGENKVNVARYAKLNDVPANAFRVVTRFINNDKDGKINDAVLQFTKDSSYKDLKLKSVYYKKIAKNDNATYTAAALLLDSELKEAAVVPSADFTSYDVLVKNVEIDSKVVFLYTVENKDYADTSFVVTVNGAATYETPSISFTTDTSTDVVAGVITGTLKETDATGVQTWKFTLSNDSEFDNAMYTYKVYYAYLDRLDSVDDVSKWTEITLTPALNSSKTAYEAEKEEKISGGFGKSDKEKRLDGKTTYIDSFAFKVVKTLKNVSDSNGYAVAYSDVKSVTIVK